MNIDW